MLISFFFFVYNFFSKSCFCDDIYFFSLIADFDSNENNEEKMSTFLHVPSVLSNDDINRDYDWSKCLSAKFFKYTKRSYDHYLMNNGCSFEVGVCCYHPQCVTARWTISFFLQSAVFKVFFLKQMKELCFVYNEGKKEVFSSNDWIINDGDSNWKKVEKFVESEDFKEKLKKDLLEVVQKKEQQLTFLCMRIGAFISILSAFRNDLYEIISEQFPLEMFFGISNLVDEENGDWWKLYGIEKISSLDEIIENFFGLDSSEEESREEEKCVEEHTETHFSDPSVNNAVPLTFNQLPFSLSKLSPSKLKQNYLLNKTQQEKHLLYLREEEKKRKSCILSGWALNSSPVKSSNKLTDFDFSFFQQQQTNDCSESEIYERVLEYIDRVAEKANAFKQRQSYVSLVNHFDNTISFRPPTTPTRCKRRVSVFPKSTDFNCSRKTVLASLTTINSLLNQLSSIKSKISEQFKKEKKIAENDLKNYTSQIKRILRNIELEEEKLNERIRENPLESTVSFTTKLDAITESNDCFKGEFIELSKDIEEKEAIIENKKKEVEKLNQEQIELNLQIEHRNKIAAAHEEYCDGLIETERVNNEKKIEELRKELLQVTTQKEEVEKTIEEETRKKKEIEDEQKAYMADWVPPDYLEDEKKKIENKKEQINEVEVECNRRILELKGVEERLEEIKREIREGEVKLDKNRKKELELTRQNIEDCITKEKIKKEAERWETEVEKLKLLSNNLEKEYQEKKDKLEKKQILKNKAVSKVNFGLSGFLPSTNKKKEIFEKNNGGDTKKEVFFLNNSCNLLERQTKTTTVVVLSSLCLVGLASGFLCFLFFFFFRKKSGSH